MYSHSHRCEISGFRHEIDKNCVLIGYYAGSSDNYAGSSDNYAGSSDNYAGSSDNYAGSSDNSLPMFRENLLVTFSTVKRD